MTHSLSSPSQSWQVLGEERDALSSRQACASWSVPQKMRCGLKASARASELSRCTSASKVSQLSGLLCQPLALACDGVAACKPQRDVAVQLLLLSSQVVVTSFSHTHWDL